MDERGNRLLGGIIETPGIAIELGLHVTGRDAAREAQLAHAVPQLEHHRVGRLLADLRQRAQEGGVALGDRPRDAIRRRLHHAQRPPGAETLHARQQIEDTLLRRIREAERARQEARALTLPLEKLVRQQCHRLARARRKVLGRDGRDEQLKDLGVPARVVEPQFEPIGLDAKQRAGDACAHVGQSPLGVSASPTRRRMAVRASSRRGSSSSTISPVASS